MSKSIFSRIIDGEIPSDKVFEDQHVIGFKDINPVAKIHILIVPKKFYVNVDDVPDDEMDVFIHIMNAARIIAKKLGVDGSYRLITNVGEGAGQSVFHMHFHLISGEIFSNREF